MGSHLANFMTFYSTKISHSLIFAYLMRSSYTFTVSSFFFHLKILQAVGLLERVISSSLGLYLNTGQHKQNKHIHIPNIHAFCGIRTNDPVFRASEVSTCLKTLGYRDRPHNLVR
jgi:hypothetical protein